MFVINFAISGLDLFLLASVFPDGHYAEAHGHSAPLYLSCIVC